jgi:hypothetical protein
MQLLVLSRCTQQTQPRQRQRQRWGGRNRIQHRCRCRHFGGATGVIGFLLLLLIVDGTTSFSQYSSIGFVIPSVRHRLVPQPPPQVVLLHQRRRHAAPSTTVTTLRARSSSGDKQEQEKEQPPQNDDDLTSHEIQSRLVRRLAVLREKDRNGKVVAKEVRTTRSRMVDRGRKRGCMRCFLALFSLLFTVKIERYCVCERVE